LTALRQPRIRAAWAIPTRNPSTTIDGERKTVTALFANIKGSMELMEDLAPTRRGRNHRAGAGELPNVDARVVAVNIPGASALAQIGTFLNVPPPGACANPIPSKFPSYIQPGAVLDPNRILVGSTSNFGAPRAFGVGKEGAFLSIDPRGANILNVPPDFASSGDQALALGGAVQMFSANSPHWLNGVNNLSAATKNYTGVSNPLGLSNNNAFGRIWPANSPFGLDEAGSSSILDPTGLPLKGRTQPSDRWRLCRRFDRSR